MSGIARSFDWRIALFGLFAVTTPIFSPNASVFRGGAAAGFMPYFIFSMFIALAVASLVLVICSRRVSWNPPRSVLICASLLYAASIVVFAALSLGWTVPPVAVAIVGAVCGASTVVITVRWASFLSALDFREGLVCSSLLCIATSLVGIGFQALPLYPRAVVYVLIAIVGGVCPALMDPPSRDASPEGSSPEGELVSTRNLFHVLHLPVIGLVIYAFMMSINKVLLWGAVDAEFIGAIVAALLIVPILLIRTDKPASAFIYRVIAPIIGGVVIVFVSFPAGTFPHGAALWLVYIFLSALAIVALGQVIAVMHAGEFRREFVVGLALFLGGVVSLCGLMWVNVFGGLDSYEPVIYVIIAVYCALMVISLGWESWRTITAVADVDGEGELVASRAEDADGSQLSSHRPSTVTIPAAISQKLTRRENEILSYLGRGHSNAYIAEKLFISESTVRTHVKHIYQKLEVHSREELFVLLDHGCA
ncbi:response regulator transcription factor [Denitrobacterium detoxificans]|uniref:response regulator transcription factor n=1 Tax=Denitrobacterium detoxificans TaxID=79604 RepID=UPI0026EDC264|nr:helix-turn-helix transcriptional regulator [Denitrobacterium detoxificans]MBE6465924.1 helix-turn-helix transcriptional regulator [Denitrobacterium detoxificans]